MNFGIFVKCLCDMAIYPSVWRFGNTTVGGHSKISESLGRGWMIFTDDDEVKLKRKKVMNRFFFYLAIRGKSTGCGFGQEFLVSVNKGFKDEFITSLDYYY